MKYIRTKDGIVKHPHPNAEVFTFRYEIIKQADTIEELCDGFVLGETKYYKPCVTSLPLGVLKVYVVTKTHYGLTVYGAIWVTDSNGVPTLKSVAKMNDKGELELL